MNVVSIADQQATLERRAERIRKLMADMARNIIAIGGELDAARGSFEVGPKGKLMGYTTWLRKEFNLGPDYASVLIRINRKFGYLLTHRSSENLPSMNVLRLLVQPKVPQSARQEVIDRVGKGEKIGRPTAKKIVRKHLPSPKKANELARDTGKPVEASDGYVYLGATDKEVSDAKEKRTVVYGAREAIATLSEISGHMTAQQFLDYAAPHQLVAFEKDAKQIRKAADWLEDLDKAWAKRK